MKYFYNKSHKCQVRGYRFRITEVKRSLQEVKDALHRQRGIAPEMVDRIARTYSARSRQKEAKETPKTGGIMLRLKSTVLTVPKPPVEAVVGHRHEPSKGKFVFLWFLKIQLGQYMREEIRLAL